MEATTKFSNFSIDRILGSGFGPSPPHVPIHTVGYIPGGYFHGLSIGQGCLDSSNVGRVSVPRPPAAPMPRAASGPYHGMDFGFGYDSYPTYGAYGLHRIHTGFSLYPNSVHTLHSRPAGFPMNTGRQPLSYLDNYSYQQQQHASERPQPRPTSRMRTMFTESQTKHLDKLFEVTDYPGVETRAELARDAGLNEETVRVWFKNRRARRKKKHCSRVDTSPYSRPSVTSKATGLVH